MRQKLLYLIKIASTILITSALGLEIWYLYLRFTDGLLPNKLYPILWLGSLALLAHLIEGAIAAFQARRQDKPPLRYGLYTFFVGFAGLLELAATSSSPEKPN
ncbi:hypothetical protein Xen7305DRAFT_00020300 [Xenococcus sp. PCC 7305]|uniref:hypothetical protein n=1 Tax=Xenococcus sp. PCC 7305 TaxID=102125 RepID=UPI0002AC9558|nr:hypothetical protein [Xenococcus sp. PCC 7305]ELS02316.1 hypothetical protein Xen7305DRAFT_00020300 [Xenococcus sp. PCC 7305]